MVGIKVLILGMLLYRVKEMDKFSFISYCVCCFDKMVKMIKRVEGKVYFD